MTLRFKRGSKLKTISPIFPFLTQHIQVAVESTTSDMTTIFLIRSYSSFIEISKSISRDTSYQCTKYNFTKITVWPNCSTIFRLLKVTKPSISKCRFPRVMKLHAKPAMFLNSLPKTNVASALADSIK